MTAMSTENQIENSMSPTIKQLVDYLNSLNSGEVTDHKKVEDLLSRCWDGFEGSSDQGMQGWKLHGKTEMMTWNPPILRFKVRRQGATPYGSIYGDVNTWSLDVNNRTATFEGNNKRRVKPRAPAMNMSPITAEVAELIKLGKSDKRLKWNGPNEVRIRYKTAIPKGVNKTYESRRQRFKDGMREALVPEGWQEGERGLWKRPE